MVEEIMTVDFSKLAKKNPIKPQIEVALENPKKR